ncbi:MAG TPA: KH domain-containing protein [Candidatus Saccharimonadales bacterium]|nr:KH domain-containing protein [Candidatus Saccharimonadales bacterium]
MNNSIDQQFVEFVVKSLVSKPDEVKVERRIDEKGVLLELTVDPEDLGRVIGKRGATAQSIRTLLRALGTKNDARYNLKIVDNGIAPPPRRDDRPAQSTSDDSAATDTSTSDDDLADLRDDEDVPAATDESDRLSRTRKELEELDDLDV